MREIILSHGEVKVCRITNESVAHQPVEAIVALVGPNGEEIDPINNLIRATCGGFFHGQLTVALREMRGTSRVFAVESTDDIESAWLDVIFVISEETSRITELVFSALRAAAAQNYITISFTVAGLKQTSPDATDVREQIVEAINTFLNNYTSELVTIFIFEEN